MSSKGINKVILIGNLGKDPEIRYTPGGDAIANLTIATSESWKDKQSGEQKEITEWHRVVAYGRLAQIMGEYLKKGSKVYVEGSLRTRKYEKNGEDRYVTEIRCNEMQMLDGASGDRTQQRDERQQQPQRKRQVQQQQSAMSDPGFDNEPAFYDDIPF